MPYTAPNEVMVIGTLQSGGLFSVQIEGAQRHRTGLHLDITGTDGVLRVTNPRGFENEHDNTVEGVTGDATWFTPLPVPAEYQYLGQSDLDASCTTSPTSTPPTHATSRTAPHRPPTSATPCACAT